MNGRMPWYVTLMRRPASLCGLAIVAAVVLMAATAGVLFPGNPNDSVTDPLIAPLHDASYPLGTDTLGRNITSGIFHGARVALLIGTTSAAAALVIGIAVGAVAGYYRGWVDDALMRITELFQTMPPFMLAIVLVVILRPSIATIVIALALVAWPPVARLIRAQFLTLREREFVQSCVLIGMSNAEIIVRQILPNALPPVIVTSSVIVATAILMESGLAFLGLGDPNVTSWGAMISVGRDQLVTAWYVAAIPGLAIVITVLGLNLLGDALNDVLNPRASS